MGACPWAGGYPHPPYICETKPVVFGGYQSPKGLIGSWLRCRMSQFVTWLRLASFGV